VLVDVRVPSVGYDHALLVYLPTLRLAVLVPASSCPSPDPNVPGKLNVAEKVVKLSLVWDMVQ